MEKDGLVVEIDGFVFEMIGLVFALDEVEFVGFDTWLKEFWWWPFLKIPIFGISVVASSGAADITKLLFISHELWVTAIPLFGIEENGTSSFESRGEPTEFSV